MPFPESLKKKIRKRANHRCCMCYTLGVDIHHIVPQVEGGDDTEDNAAPLCPNCHSTYGANPEKRKIIREIRDHLYERNRCAFETQSELKKISNLLENILSKEDLERRAIRNNISLRESSGASSMQPSSKDIRYSFSCDEFIHPLIVRELMGWISDKKETIMSVDISNANQSNRFYGEYTISDKDGKSQVIWQGDENEYFSYLYIGTSPSGVEIVECYDCGGGSGVFGSVGLFSLDYDQALGEDSTGEIVTRERAVLKILGSIGLGDRYDGEIKYIDGFLIIGPDNGWFNRDQKSARRLPIL